MRHNNGFLLRTVLMLLCYIVKRIRITLRLKSVKISFQGGLAFTFLLALKH